MATKKKMTLYFPEELGQETKLEAERQDRSLSWVMQLAGMLAREQIQEMPGMEELHERLAAGGILRGS